MHFFGKKGRAACALLELIMSAMKEYERLTIVPQVMKRVSKQKASSTIAKWA